MNTATVRTHMNNLFEELAILLGGIVVVHRLQNETVWAIVRGLDRLRRHALDRIDAAENKPFDPDGNLEPHPAIEQFLKTIREEKGVD
jgi:hypothetical protein